MYIENRNSKGFIYLYVYGGRELVLELEFRSCKKDCVMLPSAEEVHKT